MLDLFPYIFSVLYSVLLVTRHDKDKLTKSKKE